MEAEILRILARKAYVTFNKKWEDEHEELIDFDNLCAKKRNAWMAVVLEIVSSYPVEEQLDTGDLTGD
jgi:hypothetical protein